MIKLMLITANKHTVSEALAAGVDRIFIDFTDLDRKMFGWNAKTF